MTPGMVTGGGGGRPREGLGARSAGRGSALPARLLLLRATSSSAWGETRDTACWAPWRGFDEFIHNAGVVDTLEQRMEAQLESM